MKKYFLASVALLIILSNAYAAVPVVDFNWWINGTKDINTTVFQSIIFDPFIVSIQDINVIMWQFHTDGNVNYFNVNAGNNIFSDSFTGTNGTDINAYNSDYNRTRTGVTSTMKINSNTLVVDANNNGIAGGDSLRLNNHDFNAWDSNNSLEFSLKELTVLAGSLDTARIGLGKQSDTQTPILYLDFSTVTDLTCVGGGAGATTFVANDVFKFILQKTGTNTFNVSCLKNGTVFSSANTNFGVESFKFMGQFASAPAGVGRLRISLDDLLLSSSGTLDANNNRDTNQNKTFTTVGEKTICLTGGNSDGNSTVCRIINIGGNISFTILDENTGGILPNAKANFLGTIISATSSGVINIPVPSVSQEVPILIYDSNHHVRTFTFVLDVNSNIVKTVYLIDTNTGRDIGFLIKDINGQKKGGSVFRIEKNGFLVSKVRLDTNALWTIPLANIVQDYNFFVDSNTDTNSNLFSYQDTNVVVLVPLNENTLSLISPFRLIVTDLTSIDKNSLVSSVRFRIYPNTASPYKITIDANGLNYFQRFYHIRALGGETLITLQPYMLSPADNANLGVFNLSDSLTGQSIQGHGVEFRTDVGSITNVLVESQQSDSSGSFIFTTLTGKRYDLVILDQFGDVVKTGSFISSTSSTYFLDLFTGTITVPVVSIGSVDANVLIPETGFFYLNNSSNYGFSFKLKKTGSPAAPTVTKVTSLITQNGVTLSNLTFTPVFPATNYSNGTIFDVNFTGGSTAYLVNVTITFETSLGIITKNYSYSLKTTKKPSTGFVGLGNLINEIGAMGGIFLWFFIAIIISGALRFSPFAVVDNGGLVWILVIWTGIAGAIGLIPIIIGFVGILGSIAYWFMNRQPFGGR